MYLSPLEGVIPVGLPPFLHLSTVSVVGETLVTTPIIFLDLTKTWWPFSMMEVKFSLESTKVEELPPVAVPSMKTFGHPLPFNGS